MQRALLSRLLCLGCLASPAAAQDMTGMDRQRDRLMLRAVQDDIRQHYYDTTFHGLDLAALFDSTDAMIAVASSNSEAFLNIAATVSTLRDSHTLFIPPRRTVAVQYGWNLGIVGDSCYILKVDPKSDAAALGVKRGDRVIAVDRFLVNRGDRWNVEYLYLASLPGPSCGSRSRARATPPGQSWCRPRSHPIPRSWTSRTATTSGK